MQLVSGRQVEPSRFWLRRDDDDRTRQVVYDQVQLGRYSDRQRRAILKLMARGKTASHRDIRQAARRARRRSRGEMLVAITLALSAFAALVIIFAGWHRVPTKVLTTEAVASVQTDGDRAGQASAGDLTTVMENADRAWLSDVGAGKIVTATDGSDVLSLPENPPTASAEKAGSRGARARRDRHRSQR